MKNCAPKLAKFDAEYIGGRAYLMGIDEAGRGCLAGPVCAGAVIVRESSYRNEKFLEALDELNDSKKLTEAARENLFKVLELLKKSGALDFEAGFASVEEIEAHNILAATQTAMARAASALNERNSLFLRPAGNAATLFGESVPDISKAAILIDGKPMKKFPYSHMAAVKGDASSLAVAAASVVAKVSRDRLMAWLSKKYPRYGFDAHKGYGTATHLQNLMLYGPCEIHRPSFLKKLRGEPIENRQGELF